MWVCVCLCVCIYTQTYTLTGITDDFACAKRKYFGLILICVVYKIRLVDAMCYLHLFLHIACTRETSNLYINCSTNDSIDMLTFK